jgi:hypothetical protein
MSINATSTNTTSYSNPFIITYTPMEYITIHGNVGIAVIRDFIYTNTSSIPDVDDGFNVIPLSVSFFTELIGFICYIYSYKYIITNMYLLFFRTKQCLNFLDKIEPVAEPIEEVVAAPIVEPIVAPIVDPIVDPIVKSSFIMPIIDIEEKIEVDDNDSDDNQTIYTTDNGFNLTLFHADEVKIDDVAYSGECYIEIYNDALFTYEFNPVRFINPTYKDLLTLTSMTNVKRHSQSFTISDVVVDSDRTYNNVQIIKIELL